MLLCSQSGISWVDSLHVGVVLIVAVELIPSGDMEDEIEIVRNKNKPHEFLFTKISRVTIRNKETD